MRLYGMGGKGENVDKIHVICCLADLLTRFQIIKFTRSILIWTIACWISFLRNTKYSGFWIGFFVGRSWLYRTFHKEVNWGSFWTKHWNRLSGAAFLKNIQATSFFNCHVMKAAANELCRVGPLLAQVELILHCGWKLDLATPTQVLAAVWWKAVHQLRELIALKSKATRRESFCILQLVGSVSAALTGGTGSGAQAFGGGWWRLFVAVQTFLHSGLLWNHTCVFLHHLR